MSAPSEPALQCIGLSKVFRDFWLRPRAHAVRGIDLAIARGEVFGLLGPNGSGKSTTIKMMLGLLHPTAGKIAVLGRSPRDVENKRRIGYLPEESYLYKYLTPRETLDFYGQLFGLSPANRRVRCDMLLEMVGLTHAADRAVGEFSKGMQRKVGLAQALINDPEFLILDEPTSGMDPIAIAETKEVIQQLRRHGKTVLLCSHLLSEVEDVCDRVAIMYGGKIRVEGAIDDLLTVHDETTVSLPSLSGAQEAQLRLALDGQGLAVREVKHPRLNLERLFLDVISSARSEGADTAGAVAGGKLAGFLGANGTPRAESPAKGGAKPAVPEARREKEPSAGSVAQAPRGVLPAGAEARAPKGDLRVVPALVPAEAAVPLPADPLLAELIAGQPAKAAARKAQVPSVVVAADEDVLGTLLGETAKPANKPAAATPSVAPGKPKPAEGADQSVLNDLLG